MTVCFPKHYCLCRNPYICNIVDEDKGINISAASVCKFDGTVRTVDPKHKYDDWFFVDKKTKILNMEFLGYIDDNKTCCKFIIEVELGSYETNISEEIWVYNNVNGWMLAEEHITHKKIYADPAVITKALDKMTHIMKI